MWCIRKCLLLPDEVFPFMSNYTTFLTEKKKPKLWQVIVISVLVVALLFVWVSGRESAAKKNFKRDVTSLVKTQYPLRAYSHHVVLSTVVSHAGKIDWYTLSARIYFKDGSSELGTYQCHSNAKIICSVQ